MKKSSNSNSSKIELIKQRLNLLPLEFEGGFFARTYVSSMTIPGSTTRPTMSAIYYLITKASPSKKHRLKTADEMFHFYAGDRAVLRLENEKKEITLVTLGSEIENGDTPQYLVPKGTWQSLSLIGDGEFALLGCTVSPGFEWSDFELGN